MSAVPKWARRVGAAALVAAAVLGCGGACTASGPPTQRPIAVAAAPAPPPGDVVGVWRISVNGAPVDTLLVFWPGGVVGTTDPGYGVWRSRPGGAEGTWETPVAALSITYVVAVTGDALVGSGVVFDLAHPELGPRPLQMTGSRVKVDRTALGAVVEPHT